MNNYKIKYSKNFKKQLKKATKQGKDIDKLLIVVDKLSKRQILEEKYKDHSLVDSKYYKNCRECHIEPDWLLVYKYNKDEIILYLIAIGSHSDLFNM